MSTAEMIEVPKSKIEELEKEHDFLMQIREASESVREAERDWDYAKGEALEKKKAYDRLVADLNNMIEDGPAKPDPQGRLPFAKEVEADVEPDDSDDPPEEEKPDKKSAKLKIPAFIDKLQLTAAKKQVLAATGAKSVADLIEIGNRNWKQCPKGFADLDGFGPQAVASLAEQLPSTAPQSDPASSDRKARIRINSFINGETRNLDASDEYDAVVRDDNTAVIKFPGEDPIELQDYDYEVIG